MGRVVHQRGPARLAASITPMIDLTFLLIVFFVLVVQITDSERVEMELPAPTDPASAPPPEEIRVVLNLVPAPRDPATVVELRLGTAIFATDDGGRAALAERLAALYREAPGLRLNVRADRRAEYRQIEPVLAAVTDAAARAGVPPRVNLVVVRDP